MVRVQQGGGKRGKEEYKYGRGKEEGGGEGKDE